NATGSEKEPLPGKLPAPTDVRQMSLFGAGWTLGSIKYLSEAGARSLTYFETVGTRGILAGKNVPNIPGFPVLYQEFPMFAVFKEVMEFPGAEVLISKSSDPLQFEGLVLRKKNKLRIILANFLQKDISINIPSLKGQLCIRRLDAAILKQADWYGAYSKSSAPVTAGKNNFLLTLAPYAIVVLDKDG